MKNFLMNKMFSKISFTTLAVALVVGGFFISASKASALAPTLAQPTVVAVSTVKASSSPKVIGAFTVTNPNVGADTIDQFTIENKAALTAVTADIATVAIYADGGTLGVIDGADAVACAQSITNTTTDFDAGGSVINFTCLSPITIGSGVVQNYLAVVITSAGATNGRTMAAKVNAHLVTAAAWGAADLSTTNTITLDTVAPSFVSILALKQDGSPTASPTNLWYYYTGKSLKFTVTADEPLTSVKACVRPMTNNNPALTCNAGQFAGVENTDFINYATNPSGNVYAFNTALTALSALPTTAGGYPMIIQMTDPAGNITYSTLPANTYTGVFGIDPKVLVSSLNNATTTAWSSILDFTSVSNLIFNANVGGVDVGQINLTGPINLTAAATITGLQSLGTNMTVSGSAIRIDSSALAAFNGGATLTMKMSSAVRPGLVIKDNTGTVLGYVLNNASTTQTVGGRDLGRFVWNAGAQTLAFTTTGFSEFDSDNTAPTNQDTVFANSITMKSGETVTVASGGEVDGAIWFAPGGTTTFTAGNTMTTAGGTATSILTPALAGDYKLYVIDASGNVSNPSSATLIVNNTSGGGGIGGGNPVKIKTPVAETPEGCSGGNLFNTSTGKPCVNNSKTTITTTTTTTPKAYAFGNAVLKNGSKGEAVKELQRFLNDKLSLGLAVDGSLGPKTIAVIKKWQKANGLVSDGLIGAKTKAMMNK